MLLLLALLSMVRGLVGARALWLLLREAEARWVGAGRDAGWETRPVCLLACLNAFSLV